jgi:hypothetical protein
MGTGKIPRRDYYIKNCKARGFISCRKNNYRKQLKWKRKHVGH